MTLTPGYCYKLTLKNGHDLRFRYLGEHEGSHRIRVFPEGRISDIETEALKGGGCDLSNVEQIECPEHADKA